ncbi:hypothetical protein BGZ83_002196 [Gryganskiella cystojenkinii]|nr:hypothetical protein BGZ83_002196 [Gryganskiella cystojenkinii]
MSADDSHSAVAQTMGESCVSAPPTHYVSATDHYHKSPTSKYLFATDSCCVVSTDVAGLHYPTPRRSPRVPVFHFLAKHRGDDNHNSPPITPASASSPGTQTNADPAIIRIDTDFYNRHADALDAARSQRKLFKIKTSVCNQFGNDHAAINATQSQLVGVENALKSMTLKCAHFSSDMGTESDDDSSGGRLSSKSMTPEYEWSSAASSDSSSSDNEVGVPYNKPRQQAIKHPILIWPSPPSQSSESSDSSDADADTFEPIQNACSGLASSSSPDHSGASSPFSTDDEDEFMVQSSKEEAPCHRTHRRYDRQDKNNRRSMKTNKKHFCPYPASPVVSPSRRRSLSATRAPAHLPEYLTVSYASQHQDL